MNRYRMFTFPPLDSKIFIKTDYLVCQVGPIKLLIKQPNKNSNITHLFWVNKNEYEKENQSSFCNIQ